MKRRMLFLLLAALAAFGAFGLSGCSGGGGSSDESRIRGQYSQIRRGFESENLQEIMDTISRDYMNDGATYDDYLHAIASLLADYDDFSVQQDFHFIDIQGNFAQVSYTETMYATDHATGVRYRSVTDFPNDIWHWENGDWYLYGNQRTTVGLKKTLHWSVERMRNAQPVK